MELILPITILLAMTMLSLVIMLASRIYAVNKRQVKAGYFKTYQNKSNQEVPDYIIRIGRHYQNMLELPVIFYVICLVAIHFNQASEVEFLAWGFVAARIAHSLIHLFVNHVLFRMLSFMISCICLIALWVKLLGNIYL